MAVAPASGTARAGRTGCSAPDSAEGHLCAGAALPISIAFSELHLTELRAVGDITYADVAVALDELLDDPRIVEGTSLLVDGNQVTGAPSTPELRLIARDMDPLRGQGVQRVAICAESAFVYGIARMFAVFAENYGLSVSAFRTMDEAKDWLASFEAAA